MILKGWLIVCGNCPKVINSDGNAKDSLTVTENMVYDYTDQSDPPDLESFKLELVQECLKRSFFQNVPMKTYQMLKLPLIIPPSLLREQLNSDIKGSIVFHNLTPLDHSMNYYFILNIGLTPRLRICKFHLIFSHFCVLLRFVSEILWIFTTNVLMKDLSIHSSFNNQQMGNKTQI